jgi:hypothetical protein
MKTLKINVLSKGLLLGCKGDQVRVLEKCGELLVIQGLKTGRKGIVQASSLQ